MHLDTLSYIRGLVSLVMVTLNADMPRGASGYPQTSYLAKCSADYFMMSSFPWPFWFNPMLALKLDFIVFADWMLHGIYLDLLLIVYTGTLAQVLCNCRSSINSVELLTSRILQWVSQSRSL